MKDAIYTIKDRINFVWLGLLMAFVGPFAPNYVREVFERYAERTADY